MPNKYPNNLLGQHMGRLTIISEGTPQLIGKYKAKKRTWDCVCDCGKRVRVLHEILVTGRTKSCGCLRRDSASERFRRSIPLGTRFGRLVVESLAPMEEDKLTRYVCRCDCGGIKVVTLKDLNRRHTKSCGCLRIDLPKSRHGPNSPSWKAELTNRDRELRVRRHITPECVVTRKAVYARDNYTCQKCGRRCLDLHAHHICSWAEHPELRYSVDNVTTLCVKCHRALHAYMRRRPCGSTEAEVFKEWKEFSNEK